MFVTRPGSSLLACAVKPIYQHGVMVEASEAFIAEHQARSSGRPVLKKKKKAQTPGKVSARHFKRQMRKGCPRVCD